MKRKLVWALFAAGFVAVAVSFTPAGERLGMLGFLVLMAAFLGALRIAAVRGFLSRHGRACIVAGVIITLGGVALLFAFAGAPWFDPKLAANGFVALLMVGLGLMGGPHLAKRWDRDLAAWKPMEKPPTPGGFHPMVEVGAVLAQLARDRGALLRVVGPWFLLFCLAPLVLVGLTFVKAPPGRNPGLVSLVLFALAAVLLTEVVLAWVAAIQWTKFLATRQAPRLTPIPGKALWGWAWRWFVFGNIFRALDGVGPWLKAHLPAAAPWQLDGLLALLGLAAMVFFSPFALVFPSVSLDAADKGLAVAFRAYHRVGPKYLLGAALILAPYAAASWTLNLIGGVLKGLPVSIAIVATYGILTFATIIVGMTYATRVYLRGPAP